MSTRGPRWGTLALYGTLATACGGPVDQALFPGAALGLVVVAVGACFLGWRYWTSSRREARRMDRRENSQPKG